MQALINAIAKELEDYRKLHEQTTGGLGDVEGLATRHKIMIDGMINKYNSLYNPCRDIYVRKYKDECYARND